MLRLRYLRLIVALAALAGIVWPWPGPGPAPDGATPPIRPTHPPYPTMNPVEYADMLRQAAQPAESYGITTGRVGEQLLYYGYTLSVREVERAASFHELAQARPDHLLIALELILVSTDEEGLEIQPGDIFVRDSSGQHYPVLKQGKIPAFFDQPTQLNDGDKMQGWLTFEVPLTARGLAFGFNLGFDSVVFSVILE